MVKIQDLKEKIVNTVDNPAEVAADYDDSKWQRAFKDARNDQFAKDVKYVMYRGYFDMPENIKDASITWFYNSLGKEQSIYINGKQIAAQIKENQKGDEFKLDASLLHPGKNTMVIITTPLIKMNIWASVNMNPGLIQLIYPAAAWRRKLFNGKAQVIVQSTGEPGKISLTAQSTNLKTATIELQTQP
jgi:beta-galactosidase